MSAPLRMYHHKQVYFVTNRTAEGLPFVPCTYINCLLYGVLARACEMYPDISLVAWLFMGNHYHGIIVTKGDPAMFASFMNFVNGEIGKIVARLLRKNHTKIWAQRYHAALLGDYQSVVEKLVYLFINPVYAYLVSTAADWCGASTWHELIGNPPREFKYIVPSKISPLPNSGISKSTCRKLVESIDILPFRARPLMVDPFAWKSCFSSSARMSDDQIRQDVLKKISSLEIEVKLKRLKEKKEIVGTAALSQQNPYRNYRPKKFGRRVFCIVSCPDLRKQLIALYQEFCQQCKKTWEAWKVGDYEKKYPSGAFLPPRRPVANLIPLPL